MKKIRDREREREKGRKGGKGRKDCYVPRIKRKKKNKLIQKRIIAFS